MLAVKEGYEEEEKKKLKEKVKRKERDTRVTQEKNAKMIKERDKVTKDRKRIRDSDAPEIMEAERKYFEAVEKVNLGVNISYISTFFIVLFWIFLLL